MKIPKFREPKAMKVVVSDHEAGDIACYTKPGAGTAKDTADGGRDHEAIADPDKAGTKKTPVGPVKSKKSQQP